MFDFSAQGPPWMKEIDEMRKIDFHGGATFLSLLSQLKKGGL